MCRTYTPILILIKIRWSRIYLLRSPKHRPPSMSIDQVSAHNDFVSRCMKLLRRWIEIQFQSKMRVFICSPCQMHLNGVWYYKFGDFKTTASFSMRSWFISIYLHGICWLLSCNLSPPCSVCVALRLWGVFLFTLLLAVKNSSNSWFDSIISTQSSVFCLITIFLLRIAGLRYENRICFDLIDTWHKVIITTNINQALGPASLSHSCPFNINGQRIRF